MLYKPKKFKYKKHQKHKIKNLKWSITNKHNCIFFGTYALKAVEKGEIKPNHIEAVRKLLSKKIKKQGKIWIRIFSTIARSTKPAEVRMGKGKGSIDHWISVIKSGQILFEISNIDYFLAKKLLVCAAGKLPILCKFIKKK